MKTVLVTGASGAIGTAIAKAFSEKGHAVVLGAFKNFEKAENLKNEIIKNGGEAIAVSADIGTEEGTESLFSAAEKAFGKVDVLVNNAGVSHYGLFTDMQLSQWDLLIQTNLTSVFLCCRRALPNMIREKYGCIINIGSVWGEVGASCEAAYSASKAAVSGLTKALAKEEGPSNIRVNCIAPGLIRTKMNSHFSENELEEFENETALLRSGTAEEIASAAVFLLENEYVTGQVLNIDGGM
jgi:Dehydrogenases with different specificities (related to short-chain alcohol dehydrogenases)